MDDVFRDLPPSPNVRSRVVHREIPLWIDQQLREIRQLCASDQMPTLFVAKNEDAEEDTDRCFMVMTVSEFQRWLSGFIVNQADAIIPINDISLPQ